MPPPDLETKSPADPATETSGANGSAERQQPPDASPADTDQNKASIRAALEMFDPAGDIHLAAICPEGERPPEFLAVAGKLDAAVRWIQARNADRRNIYWQPNAVRPGLSGKASAEDIVAVRFFQVDIDPPKDGGDFDTGAVVERLDALENPPSFIVHSGGGIQAFWRLERPSYV